MGLPARVAVGYLPGFIDPLTGAHIVRVGDAHAWVEIQFQRHGWVAFDPTPRPDAAMGFATGRNWVYFALEDFTGITFAGILSPLAGNFSFGPLSVPGWVWVVLPSAVVATTVLALLLNRRKVRIRQEIKGYSVLDGEARRAILNLYRKMVALLVKKGLPSRQLHQPPYDYATIICSQIPDSRELVEWLSQAASSAAYDPNPLSQSILPDARRRLAELRQTLTGSHRRL